MIHTRNKRPFLLFLPIRLWSSSVVLNAVMLWIWPVWCSVDCWQRLLFSWTENKDKVEALPEERASDSCEHWHRTNVSVIFFSLFFYWNTLLCELNGGVSHTFLFYVPRLSSFPNCLTTFITWCLLSFWNSHQFFKITRRYVKTNPSLSVCRTCYNTMSRAWMSWANGKDKSCCFWRFCFQRSNCLHLWVQQNSEELKEKLFFFSDSDSVALKKKSLNVDSNVDHDPLEIS